MITPLEQKKEAVYWRIWWYHIWLLSVLNEENEHCYNLYIDHYYLYRKRLDGGG